MNFQKWVDQYESYNQDESIEFLSTTNSNWDEEDNPRFSKISAEIQNRNPPRILRDELRNIGEWKTGGRRIDSHLKRNNSTFIEQQTQLGLQSSISPEKRVDFLTEIRGVSVPVASSILAMFDPNSYPVIDFRALRALPRAEKNIDPRNYRKFSEYMDVFRNYRTGTEAYVWYRDVVNTVSSGNSLSPREIDMALWAFDKKNS